MIKQEYNGFCEEKDICIFSKSWWLDAVAGEENWDVLIYKKGDKIQAVMPYSFIRKGKWIEIEQPSLTQKSGIIFDYPKNQKYVSKLSFERKAQKYFIEEIEKLQLASFNQSFNYTFTNWLPFYWQGYSQTSRYTYVIEDTSDKDKIYAEIDTSTKNLIRKAEKSIKVYEDLDLETFYKINSMTFERKGMKIPYTIELLEKIHKSCSEHGCNKILYAKDEAEDIHAAIYLVWDSDSMYYLLGGINPDFKSSNSTSLLLKEAIFLASDLKIKFDFEGSMNKEIENFFSSFGGTQKQYFTIFKHFKFNLKRTMYSIINDSYNLKTKLRKVLKK